MTITLKAHRNPRYYITMESEERYHTPIITVRAFYAPSEREPDVLGYPEREVTFPCSEQKKALAAFNRYKRKYI